LYATQCPYNIKLLAIQMNLLCHYYIRIVMAKEKTI
jgi:hypothetical protein